MTPFPWTDLLIIAALIVLNGFIKFRINTMKGWMGERMLRRQRASAYPAPREPSSVR